MKEVVMVRKIMLFIILASFAGFQGTAAQAASCAGLAGGKTKVLPGDATAPIVKPEPKAGTGN